MNDTSNTATQAQKLRAVLDLLEQHPTLPAPMVTAYTSGTVEVDWFLRDNDQKLVMQEIRRTIGGTWDKDDIGGFRLASTRDGLRLAITAEREQVCERIVVGTEQVTIPAVEAQAERVEDREIVEWRCEPINTGRVSA